MTRYADSNKKGILEDKIEAMGGRIYRVHRKRENYLKNINDIDKIIKNGNYDIVHSHLDELSTFYLLSAKKYNVPVRICHSHLAGTDRGKGVEILCKLLKPIMRYVTTDKFACGIDAGIALWGETEVKTGQVHIMTNAIDTIRFRFNIETRKLKRDELNINESTLVLGSVGRLSYQKNSDFIIDIFNDYHKMNCDSMLLLVGVGDLIDEVNRKIDKYNLHNFVKLIGSRDDVNELLMAMDIFLLPSRFEGLPIVLVEAQCSGLPCLVSDSVTKEIKLSEKVKYISLEEDSTAWASYINDNQIFDERNTAYNRVVNDGYDICSASKNLENYYRYILGIKR